MTDVRFEIDWTEAVDYGIPEHDKTFANFSIHVGDNCVTEYVAGENGERRIREFIHRPLYPLAEWIAENWWNLLYEAFTQGKTSRKDYSHRHNLRYARSGFALPDLEFQPEGEQVFVNWNDVNLGHYRTRFIGDGHAYLDFDDFRNTLEDFLDSVKNRLAEFGITQTPFQEEWNAICSAGRDERAFCRAAAKLGVYPYALTEEQQQAILETSQIVPESLQDSFYGAANLSEVRNQAERLRSYIDRLQELDVDGKGLVDLRRQLGSYEKRPTPHEEGYNFAHLLRTKLEAEDKTFHSLTDLVSAIRLNGHDATESVVSWKSSYLYEALVATNDRKAPGFAVNSRYESGQKFALCRGLFEYLTTSNGEPLLVTKERTSRQKRNRAFAAEFLAPSHLLRDDVSERYVDEEKLEELAGKYGVSTWVIAHQIENHKIADRVDVPYPY